jgi:hypothetical protein
MKTLPIAIIGVALLATGAFAQQPRTPGPDPEARVPGHTVVGPPQGRDPRTTTGQAPIAVPGDGNPYGARGGTRAAQTPIACRQALLAANRSLQTDVSLARVLIRALFDCSKGFVVNLEQDGIDDQIHGRRGTRQSFRTANARPFPISTTFSACPGIVRCGDRTARSGTFAPAQKLSSKSRSRRKHRPASRSNDTADDRIRFGTCPGSTGKIGSSDGGLADPDYRLNDLRSPPE